MKIVSAVFLRAAEKPRDYPPGDLVEIGFVGRSNVGKSSAINTLLGRRNLVKTSKTPGHTRKLNFFLINDKMVFVDFPGYGFARVPLEMQRSWGPMIETYLKNRTQLSGVIQFVDSRRPPTEFDRVLMDFFVSFNIPFALAATKSDKLNSREKISYIRNIGSELGTEVPVIMFSSMTGFGKNELWKQIRTFIE